MFYFFKTKISKNTHTHGYVLDRVPYTALHIGVGEAKDDLTRPPTRSCEAEGLDT